MEISFSKKKDISTTVCVAIFFCFFDAVLRVEQKNGITLDRIFLVIPILGMLMYEASVYLKFIFLYSCFVVYNIILSFKFGGFDYFTEMTFHYFIISNICLFVVYLLSSTQGRDKLLKTLYFGCLIFVVTTLLQIGFDFHLPNVDIYENGEFSSFFRIANDQSLAMAAFIPILLIMVHEKKKSIYTFCIIAAAILYICINNHTKTAMGGIILFLLIYCMLIFRVKISATIFLLSALVYSAKDQTVQISYQSYTINELIIEPLSYLASFQTYETIGSIETRVNASIIGLREFFSTWATGIGYGNSVALLERPENQLEFAKSLHNDTLAFLLEQGLLAVAIYFYGIYRIFVASRNQKDYMYNIKLSAFYMMPVVILSSSGVTSNYFFLTCLFFIIFTRKQSISL